MPTDKSFENLAIVGFFLLPWLLAWINISPLLSESIKSIMATIDILFGILIMTISEIIKLIVHEGAEIIRHTMDVFCTIQGYAVLFIVVVLFVDCNWN
ncbi:hypothetical protein HDU87_002805 [Geranomyces variabilis]|uniref:Uncharacterized protein n=1 Tax=Geranomyces variabilis TaxID=109894 RepID=A0AAD5XT42_9FUNG|nr:hypothetical protein HDU87_002805 [Geranomyces variabilis]